MGCSSHFLAFGMSLLVFSAVHGDARTCSEAITALLPCETFLLGSGPEEPGNACCTAVEVVLRTPRTTPERRDLCDCIKKAISNPSINLGRAQKLPGLCHVQPPFPVDPKIDCSMIP